MLKTGPYINLNVFKRICFGLRMNLYYKVDILAADSVTSCFPPQYHTFTFYTFWPRSVCCENSERKKHHFANFFHFEELRSCDMAFYALKSEKDTIGGSLRVPSDMISPSGRWVIFHCDLTFIFLPANCRGAESGFVNGMVLFFKAFTTSFSWSLLSHFK